MRAVILLLVSAVCALAGSYSWVELGPQGTVLARYTAAGGECPAISIDGKSEPMGRRVATGAFVALVCQTSVPAGAKLASIEGEALPLPHFTKSGKPKIVAIGDTGCRIKQGTDDGGGDKNGGKWNIQNCASPADWPFQSVAEHAAREKPELVVHVGDFLYREKSCEGVKACPGGPAGDTFATWEADFFLPAEKLLRAAPWVFVRGNHESCGRAGDGWFTLLDPRPMAVCDDFTAPYLVKAGGLSMVVLDDSMASDVPCQTDACQAWVEKFAGYFETVSGWTLKGAWMLSHRPVWAVKKAGEELAVESSTLQDAWAKRRPAGVDLLLAGHLHKFELIGFGTESGHATQLILGNSGTKLAPEMTFDAASPEVKRAGIRDFRNVQDFGFTTMEPRGARWLVEARDQNGVVRVRCTLPTAGSFCGGR